MRTIKETIPVWADLKHDAICLAPDPGYYKQYLLEIEIEVPDERDQKIMSAAQVVLGYFRRNGKSCHAWSSAQYIVDELRPRPPRATIREVEK